MDPGRTKTAKRYLVYADGACLGNPGPGGWGVVIVEPPSEHQELSVGPVPNTTNNRMEITAAIEALRALEPGAEVTLRSDSEYVIKTMTLGWKRNVNRDLWEQLDREVAHRKVRFEWVPGHAGNHWNERADELARAGAQGKEPPAGAAPSKPPAVEATPEETRLAQQIETMLGEGETIRKCAGCGRAFVAGKTGETHCSLVACQLKARQKRRAAR
jgi:ribonuclease HI